MKQVLNFSLTSQSYIKIIQMKKTTLYLSLIVSFLCFSTQIKAQDQSDSTGLPGDNFSLEGALNLFKQASSPEDFEKMLNTESNHVNNLDLNEDGDIDYIRVISKMEQDVHAFILQVPISESENQDIAVIELEKNGKESAVIQIIGDEDIFGVQQIVEPSEEGDMKGDMKMEPRTKSGPSPLNYEVDDAIVINVWPWPCVRFVYAPAYRPWVSPWRWRVYPSYWHPWMPLGWRVFHPFRARYRPGFAVVHTHRVVHAHRVYTPVRTTSVTVNRRHGANVKSYRVTRTKTTVTGPRGKTKTTRTTTRVKRR